MESHTRPLTDLIEPATLQRIVDRFAAATGHGASIADATGDALARSTSPQPVDTHDLPNDGERPYAPITVKDRRVALMYLEAQASTENGTDAAAPAPPDSDDADDPPLHDGDLIDGDLTAAPPASSTLTQPATAPKPVSRRQAAHLLLLLAETISEMCQQGEQVKARADALSTLFEVSTLLSGQREMRKVLDTVARSVCELMDVKAASIRLLDSSENELLTEAVYNLSPRYLNKGPIIVSRSGLDQAALKGDVLYIEDMTQDGRIMYPEDAHSEGLVSMLCVGMIYRGKPIGVMRIYTGQRQQFSDERKNLLRAIAQIAAAAIRNAQLDAERREQMRIQRQVELAADVQRRLLPRRDPDCLPFEAAGRYEPCFEIGGDFYDFISLESSLGVVLGDVVGKGVAAGLLMASVRASLRAYVEDVYDLDDVMARVNDALVHDTRDHEFATVFYGTLDRQTLRLTYCSAGHEPAILLRDGSFSELSIGGMALGISKGVTYHKAMVDLQPGDVMLLYSDGVSDASNFAGEKFSKKRIHEAVLETADQPAREIVNHILWQVRRFVGLNYRPDDMTLVAVRVGQPDH